MAAQIAIVVVPWQIRRWILSRYNKDGENVQRIGRLGWLLGDDGIMPTGSLLAVDMRLFRINPAEGLDNGATLDQIERHVGRALDESTS